LELGDGASAAFDPESYDVAMCLGASFVFGGLEETVVALTPAVPRWVRRRRRAILAQVASA